MHSSQAGDYHQLWFWKQCLVDAILVLMHFGFSFLNVFVIFSYLLLKKIMITYLLPSLSSFVCLSRLTCTSAVEREQARLNYQHFQDTMLLTSECYLQPAKWWLHFWTLQSIPPLPLQFFWSWLCESFSEWWLNCCGGYCQFCLPWWHKLFHSCSDVAESLTSDSRIEHERMMSSKSEADQEFYRQVLFISTIQLLCCTSSLSRFFHHHHSLSLPLPFVANRLLGQICSLSLSWSGNKSLFEMTSHCSESSWEGMPVALHWNKKELWRIRLFRSGTPWKG